PDPSPERVAGSARPGGGGPLSERGEGGGDEQHHRQVEAGPDPRRAVGEGSGQDGTQALAGAEGDGQDGDGGADLGRGERPPGQVDDGRRHAEEGSSEDDGRSEEAEGTGSGQGQ